MSVKLDDLKKMLNPSQLDAVTTIHGPVLVVAGAGTGKTRVIEYRCLYMIDQGIPPEQILLLTFTRKSAREMLSRASLRDPECRRIEGGTFHSFAYRIIKRYKKALGLGENISFIDASDASDALFLLAAKLGCLEDKTRFPKKDTLRSILSMSLNRNQSIADILSGDYPHFSHLASQIEDLRTEYTQYKISRNLIDYDDMLIYLKLLLEDEQINQKVTSQFKYVMVDEFQDTNKIQADIIFSLARNHQNCMAVGDDTQSIYSFRGAYYKNMFDFPAMFSDTKIITLEYNYRSTQPILDVANAVIAGEKRKYSKVLFTMSAGKEKPTLSFFKDAYMEAQWIAEKIFSLRREGTSLKTMGVLYRSNFLSLPAQLALSKLNIPFMVYGGMKFIETAHIKDTLAFLKVHHNFRDELSLARVLMLLDGIGPRTVQKVKDIIVSAKCEDMDRQLKSVIKNPSQRKELVRVVELLNCLKDIGGVREKIKKVIDFYIPFLKKKFDDHPARQDDLKAFMEISCSYTSLEQFLVDFVTIEPPERSMVSMEANKDDEGHVTLSTVHSAKGLEWDSVFVMALMDGSFPVSYALNDEESIEEEKRLLYVAVTRAKKNLFLSMHNEGRNGGISTFNRLSRFVNEAKVLEKLETDYSWFEEEELDLDDLADFGMRKKDLNHKMKDYFNTYHGESYI
ncbi:MAG: ATP-dependent helicase [Candidatus Omnitrophota bacterium]